MKKDEIIKFMNDGLSKISKVELEKMYDTLNKLNKDLNGHDTSRKNKLDDIKLKLAPTKILKCKVLIGDIFDNYRDPTETQIYSNAQNADIKTAFNLMKLYITTDGWDRLWALLGIS